MVCDMFNGSAPHSIELVATRLSEIKFMIMYVCGLCLTSTATNLNRSIPHTSGLPEAAEVRTGSSALTILMGRCLAKNSGER